MKSKYLIITILIISLIICITRTISLDWKNKVLSYNLGTLSSKISTLESKINSIQAENESLKIDMKPRSLLYVSYEHKYRFIEKEIKVYQSPQQEFNQFSIVPENTAVKVEDAVMIDNEEMWLFVVLPKSCEIINLKGWIREKDTMPITKENQVKITNISILEGTKIYKVSEFEEIKDMKSNILACDVYGYVMTKKDSFAKIGGIGGLDFWVEEKYIEYPPLGNN